MWFKDLSLITALLISNNTCGNSILHGKCDLYVSLQNQTRDACTVEVGRVIFLVPSWRNAIFPAVCIFSSHIILRQQLCTFERGLQVVILADLLYCVWMKGRLLVLIGSYLKWKNSKEKKWKRKLLSRVDYKTKTTSRERQHNLLQFNIKLISFLTACSCLTLEQIWLDITKWPPRAKKSGKFKKLRFFLP